MTTEAAAMLAITLDAQAENLACKALILLEKENSARTIQGLEPRIRLTADHVKRAKE